MLCPTRARRSKSHLGFFGTHLPTPLVPPLVCVPCRGCTPPINSLIATLVVVVAVGRLGPSSGLPPGLPCLRPSTSSAVITNGILMSRIWWQGSLKLTPRICIFRLSPWCVCFRKTCASGCLQCTPRCRFLSVACRIRLSSWRTPVRPALRICTTWVVTARSCFSTTSRRNSSVGRSVSHRWSGCFIHEGATRIIM